MVKYTKRILVEREPLGDNPNDTGVIPEACSTRCQFFYTDERAPGGGENLCGLYRSVTGRKVTLGVAGETPLALEQCTREFSEEAE